MGRNTTPPDPDEIFFVAQTGPEPGAPTYTDLEDAAKAARKGAHLQPGKRVYVYKTVESYLSEEAVRTECTKDMIPF